MKIKKEVVRVLFDEGLENVVIDEENIDDEMLVDTPVMYMITLADGTQIENLTLNGNNFVSQEEITEQIFDGNMSEVTITDSNGYIETHTDMELIQIQKYEDGWYFIIRDIPEDTLRWMRLYGDLDYLAMMTNTQL